MGFFSDLIGSSVDEYLYERDVDGTDEYYISDPTYTTNITENLLIAQKHPILTTALTFISQLFAQADFYVKDSKGNRSDEHELLALLKSPSFTMTQTDFLESLFFNRIAGGTCVILKKEASTGLGTTELEILDITQLLFPIISAAKYKKSDFKGLKVKYGKGALARELKIKDLLFIRDLPLVPKNVFLANNDGEEYDKVNTRYMFMSRSRLDGLRQTLKNTVISLEAKETILSSNGRELIKTNKSEGTAPLSANEKEEGQAALSNIGTRKRQRRAWITKADVTWQSLHIAIRDLGLDESIKVDGNIIFSALHIPKDILSLEAKKTTYQNQKESIVAFIQGEMEPMLRDFTQTLNKDSKDRLTLVGNYDSLPVMQYILLQYYEGLIKQAKALKDLQAAGLSWEDALELCNMDPNIKRDESQTGEEDEANGAGEGETQEGDD
ncbi:MAG: phage portal protein [Chlamydiia bacterium]|nr:phage portal protein [Chlamydiia bacterium]